MDMVDRIDALCKSRGITRASVEKELSLGRGTILKWKSHTPKVDGALRIAEYFGVTVEYLVNGVDATCPTLPPPLSPDEEALLSGYRTASPEVRAIMSGVANGRYGLETEDAPLTSSLEGASTAPVGTERAIA